MITGALAGIRRNRMNPPDRKAPADADTRSLLLGTTAGAGLAARRDWALLALVMALDVADLAWSEQGLRSHPPFQRPTRRRRHRGRRARGPDLTPLAHLRAWLDTAGITKGPVFRPLWKGGKRVLDTRLSDHAVARIMHPAGPHARRRARPARYEGQSLRAGFITSAALAGADVR